MNEKYDVIIIGGGVAGLYAALNLDDNINALLIVKRDLALCNSSLAQGGVASVLDLVNDSYERHIKDTMIAGGNENNIDAVRTLVTEGPKDVMNLYSLGAVSYTHLDVYKRQPQQIPFSNLQYKAWTRLS